MYQTHGENLLNKFRSADSIRIALGQIDEADKQRVEALRKIIVLGTLPRTNVVLNSVLPTNRVGKLSDNGDCAPMEAFERVVPHSSQLS